LNTPGKSSFGTAAGRENRKTNGCSALPTPQLVKIGQVAELLAVARSLGAAPSVC
jgi:hypothetical protein